ncbi:MAG: diaminopimelate epimerase [Methanosarcinales archaeon]|nr:diaminopimelate epimerase [Methanosarcinales archaeon]MCK4651754.1 diaminopimelate epimerase [Methanosarcinales archaeon]
MIKFTKLHGNGNDFILIDEYQNEIVKDKAEFAATYCDRRFGIGADGVLFLSKSDCADIRMQLFQPDRSEAEMCGNGIRCLAKYAIDEGYITGTGSFAIETIVGVLTVDLDGEWIKVDMGTPEWGGVHEINGYEVHSVNTGVPHAVIFVDDTEIAIDEIAPKIRYAPVFPEGANVNFVKVKSGSEITIRTYERGVEAETLSCGTGAVASAYVARRLGRTGDRVVVRTAGGSLCISFAADGVAFMAGGAVRVYDGVIK